MNVLVKMRNMLKRPAGSSQGLVHAHGHNDEQLSLFGGTLSAGSVAVPYPEDTMSLDQPDAYLQGLIMMIGTVRSLGGAEQKPIEDTWATGDLKKVEKTFLGLVSGESLRETPKSRMPQRHLLLRATNSRLHEVFGKLQERLTAIQEKDICHVNASFTGSRHLPGHTA